MQRIRGFTLVELVMVIALASVVAVMVSSVLSRPLEGFMAQSRRAELTDMAAIALNRMTRDIRLAVPNSLRQPDANTLELMPIHAAGRYRANQLPDTSGNIDPHSVRYDPPRCPPAPGQCRIEVLMLDGASVAAAKWMVIYNIGAPSAGSTVWPPPPPLAVAGDGSGSVITPETGFSLQDGKLEFGSNGFAAFRYASPQHRFYLAGNVLGFRCENPGTNAAGEGTGRLLRASFPELHAAYDYDYDYDYDHGNARLLVDAVSRCRITYASATNARNALVTIELGVKKGGEEVVLLQQVHVDNAP